MLILAFVAAASVTAVLPGVARADGDPASDVLATQSLFLPQDAGIPLAQQGQLARLLADAASSGYPIRVALIASSSDLGSVTELWRQPETYARFLDQELSLIYHGPLLVVMPNGFGLGGSSAAVLATGRATLASVRIGTGAASLGTAALTAVQHLAASAGDDLTIPPATAGTSRSGAGDVIPAIAFGIGVVVIALAWTASLRARPPRFARERAAR